jgi:RNA polymerase sigma-70 factor (ECF subfamily)
LGFDVSDKKDQPPSWARHPKECQWVQLAQRGDQSAFEQLVKLHQQAAYRWAYRMVHSHDVADDIAQEAFIRLHRALERIDAARPLSPWLCRVVINLSTNYLRRKKTTISIEENPGIEAIISPDRDAQHPVHQHYRREFVAKLERSIEKLPPKFKEVFILRVQDNRSYEEIAEVLGLTMGTVMSRLSRARNRLREDLTEELKKMRE